MIPNHHSIKAEFDGGKCSPQFAEFFQSISDQIIEVSRRDRFVLLRRLSANERCFVQALSDYLSPRGYSFQFNQMNRKLTIAWGDHSEGR